MWVSSRVGRHPQCRGGLLALALCGVHGSSSAGHTVRDGVAGWGQMRIFCSLLQCLKGHLEGRNPPGQFRPHKELKGPDQLRAVWGHEDRAGPGGSCPRLSWTLGTGPRTPADLAWPCASGGQSVSSPRVLGLMTIALSRAGLGSDSRETWEDPNFGHDWKQVAPLTNFLFPCFKRSTPLAHIYNLRVK